MSTQLIILAAGKGTRMGSALPKVLVNLRGKPLIQHLLDNLQGFQLDTQPIIVVGHKYDLVQSFLGPQYIYAFQEGQLGTAHAVMAARPKIDAENVIILYGDMPFIQGRSLARLDKMHRVKDSKFSMFTTKVPNFEHEYASHQGYGRIIRDENHNLLRIKEFVDAGETERDIRELNPGIYMFNEKWLWENLDKVQKNLRGEYYLTDLVEIAVKSGLLINTEEINPLEVYGINTPDQLRLAEKLGF